MIKVVALDIYGTVLAFDDNDNSFPPRQGLEAFFDECDKRGIKVVTSSDGLTGNVKNDLQIAFRIANGLKTGANSCKRGLTIERFDAFFEMQIGPKDFSVIIGHYDIVPKELLVIGDHINRDIYSALKLGANALHCPAYGVDQGREWDFSKINLDAV